MRLSSISFTHASTAMFGLAVVSYAAVRLAGYDPSDLPGHLASPAPAVIHPALDTGQPASRPAQHNKGSATHVTRHPAAGVGRHTHAAADTQDRTTRSWSHDAQTWREDRWSDEENGAQWSDNEPGEDARGQDQSEETSADETATTLNKDEPTDR